MKRFLLFLWLCAVSVQAQPLSLDLDVQKEVKVKGQVTSSETKAIKVVLAQDYLEIREEKGRLLHDFVGLRSYRWEGDDRENRSLFADVGFRVAEMRNRLGLQQAMREAKVETEVLGDTVLVEHLFAIDDEVTEAQLVEKKTEKLAFFHGDKLLAEVSRKGKALEPSQARAFVRFVRYYCGGHPDILAKLTSGAMLPEHLRLDFYNMDQVVSYRLHLRGWQAHTAARPDLADIPLTPPGEPLRAVGEAALKLSPEFVTRAADSAASASEAALQSGDPLGAVLRLFEAMLMDGRDVSAALATMRPTLEADPTSAVLIRALILGETDPAAGEKALQPLQAQAGQGQHVVAVFRAGMALGTQRSTEARDLYVQALASNPAIVGAWKDLGDIYHSNFETDFAWACWDIGRALAPQHPMLLEVARLEEYLRTNYPGFF